MSGLRTGTRPPWVIAHRGASAARPENTLSAFDEALRYEIDGIELDVQLSRDGVPVVYHDRTLAKAGGGRRRVSSVDAAEIRTLDAGSRGARRLWRERIPTLDEVLERYGARTRLLVEIKVRDADKRRGVHEPLAEAVASAIRAHGLVEQALVLCFDADTLDVVGGFTPRLRTVLNVSRTGRMTPALRRRLETKFALSADVRALTPGLVRATHQMGKPVMTFTCNTVRTAEKALRAGVDAIMSDRPGWLRGLVSARAGSSTAGGLG